MSRFSLTVRLVAGFSAAMLVVLAATGAFVYWRVEFALDRALDRRLDNAAAVLAPLVRPDDLLADPQAAAAAGVSYQVIDAQGQLVGAPPGHSLLVTADQARAAARGGDYLDRGALLPISDKPLRLKAVFVGSRSPGSVLVVAVRRDARDEALRELLLQLVLAGLGALVVTGVVGGVLIRTALAPVERYRRQAEEITRGRHDLRLDVPAGREDEVTRLGGTLNEMLSALSVNMERQRRFVADASHELRTPLTVITARVQLARSRPRSVAEYQHALAKIEDDVTRLHALAEELLAFDTPVTGGVAELGASLTSLVHEQSEAGAAASISAGAAGVGAAGVGAAGLWVGLNETTLRRLVTNLLRNAEIHGRPPVGLSLDQVDGWARLVVEDAGRGVAAEELTHLGARFYRSAHARSLPGVGLGLSLVVETVAAAGGETRFCCAGKHRTLGDSRPAAALACQHGSGTAVTLLLPLIARP